MGDQKNTDQPCPGHVVKCSHCKGTGKSLPYIKCDVCKGVGSVLLK